MFKLFGKMALVVSMALTLYGGCAKTTDGCPQGYQSKTVSDLMCLSADDAVGWCCLSEENVGFGVCLGNGKRTCTGNGNGE